MSSFLTQLRKKPKHVRDNIAFSVAGGFTVLVGLLWFVLDTPTTGKTAVADGPQFFGRLFDQFSENVVAVKESLPTPPATTTSNIDKETATTSAADVGSSTTPTPTEPPREVMIVPVKRNEATTSAERYQ